MSKFSSRRQFLSAAAAAGPVAALGDFAFLNQLSPVSAEDAKVGEAMVRFQPEIEPIVRLLEETSREKVLEVVAEKIRSGLSYRELLAALFLAAIRNVQPRPAVGFKFHAVLVIHSAHLASISAPDADRWLPIFWAIDEFKSSQARDIQEGNWTMPAVREASIPSANLVRLAFATAMDKWDEGAADVAAAGLARTAGDHTAFESFAYYSIRDFRSIGHKAIYVANAWRTLQCIGWHHSEPVLRSLAYAMLNHNGEPDPAISDLAPDRPWRRNQELVKSIRKEWLDGKTDSDATRSLLTTIRSNSDEDAAKHVVELLNRGVAPQSIFDALFVASGEMLMRQPGIVGLHTVTTTNAMHHLFQTASDERTRQLILLQNASFLPLFRGEMERRGKIGDTKIDQVASDQSATDVSQLFNLVSGDKTKAASQLLGYLDRGGSVGEWMNAGRRLIFLKGNDSHDYKFSSAIMEDYSHISPEWRNRFLAASVFQLRGAGGNDNPLVTRIRSALG